MPGRSPGVTPILLGLEYWATTGLRPVDGAKFSGPRISWAKALDLGYNILGPLSLRRLAGHKHGRRRKLKIRARISGNIPGEARGLRPIFFSNLKFAPSSVI